MNSTSPKLHHQHIIDSTNSKSRSPNRITSKDLQEERLARRSRRHLHHQIRQGKLSNQKRWGRLDQQWHQSQRNNQRDDKGSWIKRKLNKIRLKKLHDINKIGILESPKENRNKEEFKTRRLMNVRCYKCKEEGHFVNNCPVWKKMGKAQIIEEEDKESVAENHKHAIGKLKPHEPYNQVYRERIMISGDYLVLGTENGCWNEFWYVNSTISKHMSPTGYLFYKTKECFFVEEHKSNLLYTHGIGGIELTIEDTNYTIPYVSYVPKININVLSMKQLILQGFEVEIIGDKCNITHMFDPINGKKDKRSQSEQKEDGEWMEIAMYYGFPNYCDEDLKKTFEDYLLLPHTYYEFAKGRMPNNYTEGMGTFEDQASGFADHFSTTVAVMDLNSSLGKICLGENVVEISSDKVEGSGDWDSLEYQDTANSEGKKEQKLWLEAYDGEINVGVEENLISNEYAVKLCLEHEVKRGNKIVKKELILALRGEIYFVMFIINPEEDDVEPGVIFERSFLRMTKAITDFGAGTITIYPDIDPFLEDIKEEEKSMDDWDKLIDFNSYDIPLLGGEELASFVCKIGKSNRNKKRAMKNLNLFY
nr:ARID DNA-binding domain-containing protein [Tanacetum cinerariifolium]